MSAPRAVRVLLVEDSEVYRQSLLFLLGRYEGIEVVGGVADGASCLEAVLEHRPDVVVLDYRLPDLDGGEVAAEIRDRAPEVAVVFLSASAGRAEYDAAALSGAPLVRKDEGVDALIGAVRAAAGRSEA